MNPAVEDRARAERFRTTPVEDPMVASRRFFVLALLLSLSLHGWLAAVWRGPLFVQQQEVKDWLRPLSVAITRAPSVPAPPLDASRPSSTPRPTVTVPPVSTPEAPAERSLDQSPPREQGAGPRLRLDYGELLRELPAEPFAPGAVFDPQLAERIDSASQTLRRRSRDRFESSTESGRFVGSQAASFIRVDDLCFDVVAADPLDPLSRESWYRVPCVD